MGIVSFLRKIFRKKAQEEAIQSDVEALQIDLERSKALQSVQSTEEPIAVSTYPETHEPSRPEKMELQKDSLQLGIAAGYTGRSLREIEGSLNRIESQMTTKDWFLVNFEDKTPQLVELLKKHDENEEKHFENLQNSLSGLRATAEKAPEPLRLELEEQIKAMEVQLPLTPKMNEALQIIKEAREISYEELAQRLNWKDTSGLRGLLSNMIKRTNKIERFSKDRKGFIRYKGN